MLSIISEFYYTKNFNPPLILQQNNTTINLSWCVFVWAACGFYEGSGFSFHTWSLSSGAFVSRIAKDPFIILEILIW